MAAGSKLSDHCIVDHFDKRVPHQTPLTPVWLVRGFMMYADKLMHFTGVRGSVWRALGVNRSSKNPNICNI